MSASGSRTPPSLLSLAVLCVCLIAALWAGTRLTAAGRVAYVYVFYYAVFYVGVVSLVFVSITIMIGLVSTDRLVLSIRQRVLLQSAHRATGVIAVGALFLHVWLKAANGDISVINVVIPFSASSDKAFYIGLGNISAIIMVLVAWTGIARARFIGRGKPWMWRGIHAVSYLMWPLVLMHGLSAGRPAATWVIVSYIVCVLLVLIGLAVRFSVSLNRNKDFASQAGTGNGAIQPVGKLVPTSSSSGSGRGKSRRDAAGVESWVPAASTGTRTSGVPAPSEPAVKKVDAAPISPAPQAERRPRRGADDNERVRRRRDFDDAPTQRWEFEDDEPAPRPRRGADDNERVRRRRDFDDAPTQRWEFEDDEPAPRSRRAVEDDDMPAPRARRRTEDPYADERPPARSRRYAGTEFEEESASGSRRVAGDGPRRFAEDDDIPAPRQRRRPDDERYEETPTRRRPDRFVDDEPPPRPSRSSRYADDAGSAPRASTRPGR